MATRKIIEIDEGLCTGCGDCVPNCAEGAIQIIDGKAKLVADKFCDGLGACLGHCPEGALKVIERDADEFDEEAVKELLASQGREFVPQHDAPPACPSARMQVLSPAAAAMAAGGGESASALSNWPVQLKLLPPDAPVLRDADILIAADCTAFASPDFHSEFLAGKTLLIGCPKLDNAQEYVDKLTQIFTNARPKSVSVLVMEVPCCQGMKMIVEKAAELSGTGIEVETTVLGIKGSALQRQS
jgi:NAD-dependent dihydropyrimidine dehydrogenase PreA subunit